MPARALSPAEPAGAHFRLTPRAVTIAGSDSGGGAGIQADLKTFAALGVYGASAISAITAQNTLGVAAVHPLPAEVVAQQLEAVLQDIGAAAAKTGMLATGELVEAVAACLQRHHVPNLVVDPVLVSSSGRPLLDERGQRELRQRLLPLAAVATPNIPEAEALIGRSIATDDEARDAARVLFDLGARNVIITGGHRNGDADDLLFDGTAFHVFHGQRVDTPHTHGTGCTFSAAVAAGLAQGMDVLEAVDRAKRFLTAALQQAYPIGRGISPVNHRPDNWE